MEHSKGCARQDKHDIADADHARWAYAFALITPIFWKGFLCHFEYSYW